MKKWNKIASLTFLLGIVSAQCFASPSRIPARLEPIVRVQPNGDSVTICLRGDERHHWTMTTDGWQVQENEKGYICYAKERHGIVIASKKIAKDAFRRSKCEERWLKRKGIKK